MGMEKTPWLFEDSPHLDDGAQTAKAGVGKPRIEEPQRVKGEMRCEFPEVALEPSHTARMIWNLLGLMDLSTFSKGCESVEGAARRSLKSPRILLALCGSCTRCRKRWTARGRLPDWSAATWRIDGSRATWMSAIRSCRSFAWVTARHSTN